MPIVELEKGVWLAPWEGDPGRTLNKMTAKHFKTRKAAEFALVGARNYRPFVNAQIRPTPRALGRDWAASEKRFMQGVKLGESYCDDDTSRR